MFTSATYTIFVPIGHPRSPHCIADCINKQVEHSCASELFVRIFQYSDLELIKKALATSPVMNSFIITNPSVYSCGIHYTDAAQYEKLITRTFSTGTFTVLDVSPLYVEDIPTVSIGNLRLLRDMSGEYDAINRNLKTWLLINPQSIKIPLEIATHIETVHVKFTSKLQQHPAVDDAKTANESQ